MNFPKWVSDIGIILTSIYVLVQLKETSSDLRNLISGQTATPANLDKKELELPKLNEPTFSMIV